MTLQHLMAWSAGGCDAVAIEVNSTGRQVNARPFDQPRGTPQTIRAYGYSDKPAAVDRAMGAGDNAAGKRTDFSRTAG